MSVADLRENYDLLFHVPLDVRAELGGCALTIEQVLKLGPGSIVDLNRAVGSPIDMLVNDKVVARGEIVAVNGNFGVRITELVARR